MMILGIVVSSVLVYVVWKKVDPAKVWHHMKRINVGWLLVSQLGIVMGIVMAALRSKVVLSGMPKIRFRDHFKSILVAMTGNMLLPARLGELLRVDFLARRGECARVTTLGAVGIERLFDLLFLVILFFSVLPLLFVEAAKTWLMASLGGCVLTGVICLALFARYPAATVKIVDKIAGAIFGKRIGDWIVIRVEQLASGVSALADTALSLRLSGATILFWGMGILNYQVFFLAFGLQMPWYGAFVFSVFISAGIALPASPVSIGTFHYFAISGLVQLGVGTDQATSVAIVMHLFCFGPIPILAGLAFMSEIWDSLRRYRSFQRGGA
jgi:uncharacterized protein (TIRG00374 family)